MCKYPYSIKEINLLLYLIPDSTSEIVIVEDSVSVKIKLSECCHGELQVESFFCDSMKISEGEYFCDGVKIIEGKYDVLSDTLRVVTQRNMDPIAGIDSVSIENYYLTIKDGRWQYWNKEGKLEQIEIWNNGELVRREEY